MKLELKHLAPYLPYKLKVLWNSKYEPFKEPEIIFLDSLNTFIEDYSDSHFKPILRPLSDIDTLIEVNGKKFVPIKEIRLFYTPSTLSYYGMAESIKDNPLMWSYVVVEKLIEWGFDVFKLIPQNLAIDINTL